MKKDTAKLLEELKNCSDFKSFYSENEDEVLKVKLSDYLNGIIKEKGIKKSDIVKKSEMSEVYAYQILSGVRFPERNKLLCLAFGLDLSFDEVQTMLKTTGYTPLYAKIPFDCVLIYAFCNHLSIVETNALLYDYGEETLG